MTQWTVRTRDGIELLDPSGQPVHLAYRKVGELLMVLLNSPDRTAPRRELGALLWPGSSATAQATNLRQAIAKLREAVGLENIIADRHECGVAKSFPCEIGRPNLSKSDGAAIPDWLGGWLLFLEGLSLSSPIQFFEAIRANVDLLGDLPTQPLNVVVNRAANGLPRGHRLEGWKSFAIGVVCLGDVPKASTYFLSAAKNASASNDSDLFSRSVFWLCACQILLGRVGQASVLAAEALELVQKRGATSKSLLTAIQATVSLHLGRFAESRDLMAEASDLGMSTDFEHDRHESLRAFYLATTGYEREAMRLVGEIRRNSVAHRGGRVEILTDLTSAAVEAMMDPSVVIDTLEPRISMLASVGQQHFALYATETLASALARCNRKKEANAKLAESRRVRRGLGITYTSWDLHRLAPFSLAG